MFLAEKPHPKYLFLRTRGGESAETIPPQDHVLISHERIVLPRGERIPVMLPVVGVSPRKRSAPLLVLYWPTAVRTEVPSEVPFQQKDREMVRGVTREIEVGVVTKVGEVKVIK